jgi:hypothetical protein
MCEKTAVKCHLCRELNEAESGLIEIVLAMRKIQKTLAPIMHRYEEVHRAHPRCALCTIMVGSDHMEVDLVPEPMVPRAKGQKRYAVCNDCYKVLARLKRSVPQQIKYQRHVEEELVRVADEDDKVYDGFWKKFREENPLDQDAIDNLNDNLQAVAEAMSEDGEEDA